MLEALSIVETNSTTSKLVDVVKYDKLKNGSGSVQTKGSLQAKMLATARLSRGLVITTEMHYGLLRE